MPVVVNANLTYVGKLTVRETLMDPNSLKCSKVQKKQDIKIYKQEQNWKRSLAKYMGFT